MVRLSRQQVGRWQEGSPGLGFFENPDDLTLFADNLAPHVPRHDWIPVYRREPATRIEAGQPLASGSEEELKLRACAVHAVELLMSELHFRGHRVNAMGLDQLLWNRGQQPDYRCRPRHRTRTLFY